MARILKEKEHTVRRNEILDAAQRLVYTKGYQQMTIQDILDSLQISKGAFYHYYDSKQALLEALVDRTIQEAVKVLLPIVQDPSLPALEKLQRFYDTAARWKTAQKDFLLALLRIWYADDNALMRQKEIAAAVKQFTPLLSEILRQGIQEGTFTTPYPDLVGEVFLSLITSFGDIIARLLINDEQDHDVLPHLQNTVAAYTDALERVLGAPPGSLQLVDTELLKEWIVSPQETIANHPERERIS